MVIRLPRRAHAAALCGGDILPFIKAFTRPDGFDEISYTRGEHIKRRRPWP